MFSILNPYFRNDVSGKTAPFIAILRYIVVPLVRQPHLLPAAGYTWNPLFATEDMT